MSYSYCGNCNSTPSASCIACRRLREGPQLENKTKENVSFYFVLFCVSLTPVGLYSVCLSVCLSNQHRKRCLRSGVLTPSRPAHTHKVGTFRGSAGEQRRARGPWGCIWERLAQARAKRSSGFRAGRGGLRVTLGKRGLPWPIRALNSVEPGPKKTGTVG